MDSREFKELRLRIGWTQERLAQELGITARQIINYETGRTPIKAFIAKQFKALASEILEQDDSLNRRLGSEKIPEYMKSQTITANYYPDISISAGYGRAIGELESTTITIPVGILGNITGLELRKRYDALRVYGDSMLPYIKDGEIALIELTEQAVNGDVVVANICDNLYIKYFECHPLGKWVRLRSHNKEYSDIELVGDEVGMLRIVGILRATISVKVF